MDQELDYEDLKPKKLYRSSTEKVLFGVAGGIAEYFNIDPTWIRLVFVFLTLAGGSGLLLYVILALVMPRSPEGEGRIERGLSPMDQMADKLKGEASKVTEEIRSGGLKIDRRRNIIGAIFIIAGLVLFFGGKLSFFWIDWDYLWPTIIILIGVAIIFNVKRGK